MQQIIPAEGLIWCVISVATYLLLAITRKQEQTNNPKVVEMGQLHNTHLSQESGSIWIQFWYVIHTPKKTIYWTIFRAMKFTVLDFLSVL